MRFTGAVFFLLLTPMSRPGLASSDKQYIGQMHSLVSGKQDPQGPTLIQITHKRKPGYVITWGALKKGTTQGARLTPLPAKAWQELKLEMDQLKQAKKFKTTLAGCVRTIEFTTTTAKGSQTEMRCWDTANRNEQLKLDLFIRKAYAFYSRKNL